MFTNPFSFEGRIRRTEYALSLIIYFITVIAIAFLVKGSKIMFIIILPLIWFVWAQGAKRCHDLGSSGWYQLIPFYGFWMLFEDSVVGFNEYGPNPKDVGNDEQTNN